MAVVNMALAGKIDPARIRQHPAAHNILNILNILSIPSDLRRNRRLVTDPVSDQDRDSRNTDRSMGQGQLDKPLAGVSQDNRRLSGQIREATKRHVVHAIDQKPDRGSVSASNPPMRRVTIQQCAQKQRDARTGIAPWAWMRNLMYPKESLNV